MDLADRLIAEAEELIESGDESAALVLLERLAASALNVLSVLYLKHNYRTDVAVDGMKLACRIDKGNYMLRSNLSHVYNSLEQHKMAAEASCVASDMCNHADHGVAFNTAIIMNNCQRIEESLAFYRLALSIYPPLESFEGDDRLVMEKKLAQIRYNYGTTMMSKGGYKEGQEYYESRLIAYDKPASFVNRFRHPRWTGEDLANKKLIIYSEQGIGDLFQFSRFLRDLVDAREVRRQAGSFQYGAEIILEAQEAAADILAKNFPDIKIIPRGHDNYAEPPEADYAVSLCSLPYILGYDDISKISGISYIVSEDRTPPRELEECKSLRVGLAWAGNPDHGHDFMRSCPLRYFWKLTEVPGVEFFSFQKDIFPTRIWKGRAINIHEGLDKFPIKDITPFFKSFSDTAVCLKNIDLLISIDSATSHLAAAMGRPTWMIIPFIPDWRWMSGNTSTTFWYDSMRIYRQKVLYDWDELMERVKEDLLNLSRNRIMSCDQ